MRKVFYGWWVVAGGFIMLFCAGGMQYYAFPVFFEAMVKEMGWSRAQTAAPLSIGLIVMGAISPIIGILIHRVGLKTVMIVGSIIAGFGFFLLSTVTELWQFYLYYGLILSIGIAGIHQIPNVTAVGHWFVKRRSTALGITTAGMGAGGAVMAPLAALLISTYDWQTSYLFLAGMVVVIGLPISAFIMRYPRDHNSAIDRQEKDVASDLAVEGASFSQAIRSKTFWLIGIGTMLWGWGYSAGVVHQVAFAVDIGIDRVAAAGALGLLTAFSVVGRVFFGRLGDTVDKRYIFMAAAALQMVAFMVLMRTTSLTMLYLYSFLLGINLGGEVPVLPGLMADHFGRKNFGVIYGVAFFMLTLGSAIGPIYGGWIFDFAGNYSASFLTSIILSFIAIVVVYLSGRPKSQKI